MPEEIIKTQYYPSDLSNMLDLGEILSMYVCDDGRGHDVLRIMSNPKPAEEFRTVKASPKKKHAARKPAARRQMPSADAPGTVSDPCTRDPGEGLGARLGKGFGAWMSKPMKRPDLW